MESRRSRSRRPLQNRTMPEITVGAVVLIFITAVLTSWIQWGSGHAESAVDAAVSAKAPSSCPDPHPSIPYDNGVQSGLYLVVLQFPSARCYSTSGPALVDGQDVSALAEWDNTTRKRQDDLQLQVTLPDGMVLVPGTSVYTNGSHRKGVKMSDNLVGPGVNLGSYDSGTNVYIQFQVQFRAPASMKCGVNHFGMNLTRIDSPSPPLNETVSFTYAKAC